MTDHQIYYETMYILRPDIAEDEVTKHIDKYNKLLEDLGGKILDSQMRGKRRLAYPIGKHKEGIYVQLSHQGDGQHIAVLEKAMRLTEDVIRYLTVKQDGPLPAKRVVKTTEKDEKDEKEVKDEKEDKGTEKQEPAKDQKNAQEDKEVVKKEVRFLRK